MRGNNLEEQERKEAARNQRTRVRRRQKEQDGELRSGRSTLERNTASPHADQTRVSPHVAANDPTDLINRTNKVYRTGAHTRTQAKTDKQGQRKPVPIAMERQTKQGKTSQKTRSLTGGPKLRMNHRPAIPAGLYYVEIQ